MTWIVWLWFLEPVFQMCYSVSIFIFTNDVTFIIYENHELKTFSGLVLINIYLRQNKPIGQLTGWIRAVTISPESKEKLWQNTYHFAHCIGFEIYPFSLGKLSPIYLFTILCVNGSWEANKHHIDTANISVDITFILNSNIRCSIWIIMSCWQINT